MKALSVLGLFLVTLVICYHSVPAKEADLVLYCKFDDLDGDQVRDHSGMGNHGTAMGQYDLVEGRFGKGVQMDGGQSNYVEVADADSLDLTEVYTMAVWAKFAEITGLRHQFFFDKGADDKAPGGWRLGKVMSGELRFQIFKDGAWQTPFDVRSPGFVPDEWYHAAVTREQSGTTTLYLNGEVGATMGGEACILPENDNALIVWGSSVWGTNNMFTGVLDELAIFNGRALSQGEIQHFMESGDFSVKPVGKLAFTWGNVKY